MITKGSLGTEPVDVRLRTVHIWLREVSSKDEVRMIRLCEEEL